MLSRLGDVGLIPAICTGQEGRRPARWHTELGEQLRHWRAGPGWCLIKPRRGNNGTATPQGLAAWRAEAPGVLARMIVRCARVLEDLKFYGTREDAPTTVMSRFGAVVAEADPFARWLSACTCDGAFASNDDLRASYLDWCAGSGEAP